jgi:hypothetical protein
MLCILHDDLNLTDSFDTAVFTAACDVFWGQCHLGQLLCESTTKFHPSRHPTRTSISYNTNSATVSLPWTKTTKSRGNTIILTPQLRPLDPMLTHRAHTAINNAPNNTHLYAYNFHSQFHPLMRNTFLARCNSIWATRGYPCSTGHSFQIGGMTELLLARVHPDVVKAMGRWSSDSFLVYWRSLGDLAPLHAANIPNCRST